MSRPSLKKILIVDDEKSILFTLSHLLMIAGVEVHTCAEVAQAYAALADRDFDLVIADLRMSGVDGHEGLELLSHVKESYAAEVIIMTGFGSPEIEEEAYRRGAYRFLRKPVELDDLLLGISSLGIPVRG